MVRRHREGETYLGKGVDFVNVVLDHIRVVSWKVLSLYEQQSVENLCGLAGGRTWDIVHFDLIGDTGRNDSPPGGAVAVILAVVQIRGILELFLQGQLVKLLSERELPVDFLLGNVKASDVEESLGA